MNGYSNNKGGNMYNIFMEIIEDGKYSHGFLGHGSIIASPAVDFTSKFMADSVCEYLNKNNHPDLKTKAWVIKTNLND